MLTKVVTLAYDSFSVSLWKEWVIAVFDQSNSLVSKFLLILKDEAVKVLLFQTLGVWYGWFNVCIGHSFNQETKQWLWRRIPLLTGLRYVFYAGWWEAILETRRFWSHWLRQCGLFWRSVRGILLQFGWSKQPYLFSILFLMVYERMARTGTRLY